MTPRIRHHVRRVFESDACLLAWALFSIGLGVAHHLGWLS